MVTSTNGCQTVALWVSRSVGQCITGSLGQWITRSLGRWVMVTFTDGSQAMAHWVTRSLGQCVTGSVYHRVTGSLGHWITRSLGQWVMATFTDGSQAMAHGVTSSVYQWVTRSMNTGSLGRWGITREWWPLQIVVRWWITGSLGQWTTRLVGQCTGGGVSGKYGFTEAMISDSIEAVRSSKDDASLFETIFTHAWHRLQHNDTTWITSWEHLTRLFRNVKSSFWGTVYIFSTNTMYMTDTETTDKQ